MICKECLLKEKSLNQLMDIFDKIVAYADTLNEKNRVISSRIVAEKLYGEIYGSNDAESD